MKKTIKTLTATTTLTLAGFFSKRSDVCRRSETSCTSNRNSGNNTSTDLEAKPTEALAETTATPTTAAETTMTPTEATTPTEAPVENNSDSTGSKESVEEVHSPDLMSAVEKAKSLDIKV